MNAVETSIFAVPSPVGWWTVTTSPTHVSAVDYVGESAPVGVRTEAVTKLEQRLDCMFSRYFRGEDVAWHQVPVAFPPSGGTLFPDVMQALRTIPSGQVLSYQDIALRLGKPQAMRAVGNALGRNPVPIIVPCHRVVAKHRRLGGFMRGQVHGSRIKAFLLGLEGHQLAGERLLLTAVSV